MRITDDRYARDRQRFDLALRMIRHEARTCTIRTWTGLSDDRIRKLYRSYVASEDPSVKRHRGKAPAQSAFFLRNLEIRRQTAALAGLFALLGLLHAAAVDRRAGATLAALRWGESFCRVYETYRALNQAHRITFEHASYLLQVLQRRAELRPERCPACEAFTVVDTLRLRSSVCALCESELRVTAAASG